MATLCFWPPDKLIPWNELFHKKKIYKPFADIGSNTPFANIIWQGVYDDGSGRKVRYGFNLSPSTKGLKLSDRPETSSVATSFSYFLLCTTTVKSSMFSASFWGTSRLGSAFVFMRWFKLTYLCIKVTTLQKGVEQGVCRQICTSSALIQVKCD